MPSESLIFKSKSSLSKSSSSNSPSSNSPSSNSPSSKSPTARDRILEAGAEMLASVGLAQVNTNSIARAAGVGVGTFYTHFDDKFSFYRELMAIGLAGLQDALAQATRDTRDESLEDQVRASVAAFVDFGRGFPALYRVIFAGGEALAQGGRAGVGFSSRGTENRLMELQRAGQLDSAVDVGVAARVFIAGQGQILLWWLDAPNPPPPEPVIETLVRRHPALACRR